MRFSRFVLLCSLMLGSPGARGETFTEPDVVVDVLGMVCSFCVQGIEKAFREQFS